MATGWYVLHKPCSPQTHFKCSLSHVTLGKFVDDVGDEGNNIFQK
jgi:hypothetical protein